MDRPKRRSGQRSWFSMTMRWKRRRLVVRFGTRAFMFWMVVWSLLRLGLLGSSTSVALGLGEGIWVVGRCGRGALLRIGLVGGGDGGTAAGRWRRGGVLGGWGLVGARRSGS